MNQVTERADREVQLGIPRRFGRRLVLGVGLLIPGLLCFTTVGRLWYLPGALITTAPC